MFPETMKCTEHSLVLDLAGLVLLLRMICTGCCCATGIHKQSSDWDSTLKKVPAVWQLLTKAGRTTSRQLFVLSCQEIDWAVTCCTAV